MQLSKISLEKILIHASLLFYISGTMSSTLTNVSSLPSSSLRLRPDQSTSYQSRPDKTSQQPKHPGKGV